MSKLDLLVAKAKDIDIKECAPFWTGSIKNAWQLVEEMVKDGQDIRLEYDGYSSDWYFGYSNDYCEIIYTSGTTPQESICKGYLEWCDLTRKEN